MPGGAPIDCAHPLKPHRMKNATKVTAPMVPVNVCVNPKMPISRLATADTKSPVAMKRRMLQ